MRLPSDLTGQELVKGLKQLGFEKLRQSGSHVIVVYLETNDTISIPLHRPIKRGTLRSILKSVEELTGKNLFEILDALK